MSNQDTAITIEFTYTVDGRWHTVESTMGEYARILNEASIDDKPICAIKICAVTRDEDVVEMCYDFVLKAQNQNPWRVL